MVSPSTALRALRVNSASKVRSRTAEIFCFAFIVAVITAPITGAQSSTPSAFVVSALPTRIDGLLGGKLKTVFFARYRAEGRCGIRVWSWIEMPPSGKGFNAAAAVYLIQGQSLPNDFWLGTPTGEAPQQRSLLWNLKTTDATSLEMVTRSGGTYDPLSPALLAFGDTGFILGYTSRRRALLAMQRLHAAIAACQPATPAPSPTPS